MPSTAEIHKNRGLLPLPDNALVEGTKSRFGFPFFAGLMEKNQIESVEEAVQSKPARTDPVQPESGQKQTEPA